MPIQGQRIVLASRPVGAPKQDDFRTESFLVPDPKPGEVLVETVYASVDPYMRGRMNDTESYTPPYPLNGVIEGGVIAKVLSSQSEVLAPGDYVLASYGWQTRQSLPVGNVRRIDPAIAPVRSALGVLGMTGLTAYFGLLDIGKPQPGETVVVSGAAGAVGMVVGQIAKLHGAYVVGIAGSAEKCQRLTEHYEYDAAVDYHERTFDEQLKGACPNGVDIYFDNVGGPVSDAVLRLVNRKARIAVCGQISLYNRTNPYVGLPVPSLLLVRSALMQGFLVGDYASRFDEGRERLSEWLKQGQLKSEDTVVEGFNETVSAFLKLFSGENVGKMLVKFTAGE